MTISTDEKKPESFDPCFFNNVKWTGLAIPNIDASPNVTDHKTTE